jgi:Family of unknown function (DUF6221)
MSDLVAFLRARLDEDEAVALAIHDVSCDVLLYEEGMPDCNCGYPARVLREVEAKRAIMDAYEAVLAECATMLGDRRPRTYGEHDGLLLAAKHLAAVFEDHPGYDEAWKP